MARVSRRLHGPRLRFNDDEVLALRSLLDALEALLRDDDGTDGETGPDTETVAGPDSDASVIAALSWPEPGSVAAPDDPALQRLLPDAYPDDPEAAADFRRYTEATLREGMLADLDAVRASLLVIGDKGQITLDDDEVQSWLRALNHGRLVMASRLGVVRAADDEALDWLDDDDPRSGLVAFYRWSGGLLSDLLDALG